MRKTVLLFIVFLMVCSTLFSGRKVYWHFDIWCTKDAHYRNVKYTMEETFWVTLVEVAQKDAYPEIASMVENRGGRFEGVMLAFVKGAAFRKGVTVETPVCCKEGFMGCARSGIARMSWSDSWAEPVYAVGQLYSNKRGRNSMGAPFFRLRFTPRKYLKPNGEWVTLGPPVSVEAGGESEVLSSSKFVYNSPYTYYSKCGKEKRKQYKSIFNRYWNLKGRIPRLGGFVLEQYVLRSKNMLCLYSLTRTHSPRHPSWKKLEDNR